MRFVNRFSSRLRVGTTHAHFVEKRASSAVLKTYDTLDQMQVDLASDRVEAA
ncbi:hypothetical protein [Ensifer sp. NM-2]|uniref:hypothetical protein n=1 Tax=Ensifer TaxID=106591 RepID=UPI0018EE1973|nr:hypothetical protein [Ensifer sp. NM-2]